MNKSKIISALHDIGAIQQGEFTLKSGLTSPFYIDLRRIISYPTLLNAVANALWETIKDCHFDLICGVPYTALPIATCISLQHNIPMVMRRKEKKTYGTKQQIEGVFQPGQICLIIEDVITTGSSIIETATELASAGLIVKDAAVLINREQGAIENLQKQNYTTHSVFTLKEALNLQC
jgi:uridine monophosphate synthetase